MPTKAHKFSAFRNARFWLAGLFLLAVPKSALALTPASPKEDASAKPAASTAANKKDPPGTSTVEVKGSLDKEDIRKTIQNHINEVKFCYEKRLTAKKDLAGTVLIKFTISTTGAVTSPSVQQSTLNDLECEQCITSALSKWVFPQPKGGVVVVSYPFVLKSVDDRPPPPASDKRVMVPAT